MKNRVFYSIALCIALVAGLLNAVGGAVYFVWNLSLPAIVVIAIASVAVSVFLLRLVFGTGTEGAERPEPTGGSWVFGLVPVYVLAAVCELVLWRSGTVETLTSPWSVVPTFFWVTLVLLALCAAALLMKNRTPIAAFLIVLPVFGVGLSVALAVYRIGFGFDPFIHQAAERYIIAHGMITPKTPYYAGQYALVVTLARLTTLPVRWIDTYLLPALATLSVPAALAVVSQRMRRNANALMLAALVLFPLAPFINTTPFGLATLYTLLAAICGLAAATDRRMLVAVWIFATAALMTHPLAGIPAIVLATLLQFKNVFVRIASAIVGAAALPAMFVLLSVKGGNGGLNTDALAHPMMALSNITLPFEPALTRFHALGDTIYALGILVTLATIAGLVVALQEKTVNGSAYLMSVASTMAAGILLALVVSFSYLPAYEQGGYPARLLALALVIAAAPAILCVSKLFARATSEPLRVFTAILLAAFIFAGGVYLAYPRSDAYVLGHGYSTSETDIRTVHSIADDAGAEPYIVLASQPVSAAALGEFGFFRYYDTTQGPVFTYPVPTGGPLYPYFLKMIYQDPTAEYMRQAMELARVKRGYFVMNIFWTGADHVIARAKQTADSWYAIDNADYVFKFKR